MTNVVLYNTWSKSALLILAGDVKIELVSKSFTYGPSDEVYYFAH